MSNLRESNWYLNWLIVAFISCVLTYILMLRDVVIRMNEILADSDYVGRYIEVSCDTLEIIDYDYENQCFILENDLCVKQEFVEKHIK